MPRLILFSPLFVLFAFQILSAHAPTFDGELSLKQLVQKSSTIVYAECSLVTENSGERYSYYNFNVVETLGESQKTSKASQSYVAGDSFTLRLINLGAGDKIKIKNNLPVFKKGKEYFLFLKEKSAAGYPVIAGGFARGVIPKIQSESGNSLAFLGKAERVEAVGSPKILSEFNKKGASLQQIKDLVQAVYAEE